MLQVAPRARKACKLIFLRHQPISEEFLLILQRCVRHFSMITYGHLDATVDNGSAPAPHSKALWICRLRHLSGEGPLPVLALKAEQSEALERCWKKNLQCHAYEWPYK